MQAVVAFVIGFALSAGVLSLPGDTLAVVSAICASSATLVLASSMQGSPVETDLLCCGFVAGCLGPFVIWPRSGVHGVAVVHRQAILFPVLIAMLLYAA